MKACPRQGRDSEKLQLLFLATCEATSWEAFPRVRVDMQNKRGGKRIIKKNNSVFYSLCSAGSVSSSPRFMLSAEVWSNNSTENGI